VQLRRLCWYWLIFVLLMLATLVVLFGVPIIQDYRYQSQEIQRQRYILLNQPNHPMSRNLIRYYGSVQAALSSLTLLPLDETVRRRSGELNLMGRTLLPIALMYVAWPWLTVLTLMIFRTTVRRAHIKPGHIVRCAIYSVDTVLLLGIALAAVLMWEPLQVSFYWQYTAPLLDPNVMWVLGLGAALLTIRLCFACRMYLRFPNAIATCLLSQAVVVLALLAAYLL
jgi:hypothetical protein